MQSQADLIWGNVRSSVISTGMMRGRGRRTDFRDHSSHIKAFGVANAATVLSEKTRADAFESVSGDEVVDGASQNAGCQREDKS